MKGREDIFKSSEVGVLIEHPSGDRQWTFSGWNSEKALGLKYIFGTSLYMKSSENHGGGCSCP